MINSLKDIDIKYVKDVNKEITADYVDWNQTSCNQTLSESFIREFKDTVDWECILCYQNISNEFILEFKDKFENMSSVRPDKSVFHCGKFNRTILRHGEVVTIGCFKGTKDEAIKDINISYSGQSALDYIAKVEELFLP